MDDEDRIHRQKRSQDQTIQQGLVVGDDEQPPLGEVARVPFYLDAKRNLQQGADHRLEHGGFLVLPTTFPLSSCGRGTG